MDEGDYVPGELVVRYRTGVDAAERAATRRASGARLSVKLPIRRMEKVKLRAGQDVGQGAAAFERRPEVLYAEPNYIYTAYATPNDPGYGQLWGMNNTGQTVNGSAGAAGADIDAAKAWDITTGSTNVTVAVVDSGVEFLDHFDLYTNIWLNPGEWPGTGSFDDDSNGLVDDLSGWDWVDGDMYPIDLNGHGTHVAGTIGARGNDGFGVVGVNWQVKIMVLRVLDANAQGTTANIVSAFQYAGAKGAKVVNASLGGPGYSQAMRDAIVNSPNTLFVVAAGNGGGDQIGDNVDVTPDYPCSLTAANLICVAATDQNDNLTGFSNYGATSVDLAAPGTNILSTYPIFKGVFAYENGTSMSSPHVAGAAGLVYAHSAGSTPTSVRNAILGSVEVQPSLQGKVATGGRLNVFYALGGQPPSAPAPSPTPTPASPTPTLPEPDPTATVKLSFPRPGSKIALKSFKKISGKVTDAGDARRVTISLRLRRSKRCWALARKGLRKRKCSRSVLLRARGLKNWRYRLGEKQRRSLRTGDYLLRVRLTTKQGKSVAAKGHVKTKFKLKQSRKRS